MRHEFIALDNNELSAQICSTYDTLLHSSTCKLMVEYSIVVISVINKFHRVELLIPRQTNVKFRVNYALILSSSVLYK